MKGAEKGPFQFLPLHKESIVQVKAYFNGAPLVEIED